MSTSPKTKPAAKAEPPKLLSWEDIENAEDRPTELVEVPEWGGSVKIRAISQRQKQDMRDKMFDAEGNFDANRYEDQLLLTCVVEPELTPERLGAMKEKAGSAVDRISTAIISLNKQGGGELASSLAQFL